MADVGPPIALIAVGAILWLAITATIGGISIQTIGLILTIIGVVWLVIGWSSTRRRRHRRLRDPRAVVDRPVAASARCSSRTAISEATRLPTGRLDGCPGGPSRS